MATTTTNPVRRPTRSMRPTLRLNLEDELSLESRTSSGLHTPRDRRTLSRQGSLTQVLGIGLMPSTQPPHIEGNISTQPLTTSSLHTPRDRMFARRPRRSGSPARVVLGGGMRARRRDLQDSTSPPQLVTTSSLHTPRERKPFARRNAPQSRSSDQVLGLSPLRPSNSFSGTTTSFTSMYRSPKRSTQRSPLHPQQRSSYNPVHRRGNNNNDTQISAMLRAELSAELSPRPTRRPVSASPPSAPTNDPAEEESIALARLLMAQEAMNTFTTTTQQLRQHADEYSQEDYAALQAALSADLDDDDDDDDDGFMSSDDEMSYDMMLRLGECMGDVKQERWKEVSKKHISKLEKYFFSPDKVAGLDENDSKCKCLICLFPYQKKEELRKLPCGHCFHTSCVDHWLDDNDFCPYCRQPVVKEY